MKRQKITYLILILYIISMILPSTYVYAAEGDSKNKDTWPKGPGVNAESAIVMEASTGLILYEKNIDTKHYPASITKIMTALLAIENSSLGDTVTFSKDAVFNVDLDSSRIGIDVGEQLTMQQCLYGILLESANEVTYAVAEHVGGTIPNFAKMMNDRAKEIGCTNTHFVNPHGLQDPDHYTSAHDMALITREAMKNDTFRKIFGTRTYQIPPTNIQKETRYLRNHHKFVLNQDHHYEGTEGGKTGYTTQAQYTLVTVAKRGDLELICVVMKDDSLDHQYTDTQKLLDFGFDSFSIYSISDLESNRAVDESPMFTRYNPLLNQTESPLTTDGSGYVVLPNSASLTNAEKSVSFYPASERKKGSNVVGTISYTYAGKYVGGANILFSNANKPTLSPPDTGTKNPTSAPVASSQGRHGINLRPIIIGAIVGVFVLLIILYFIFVERPRLKRKSAYYRKRANRRRHKDDDYLDF